MFDMKVRYDLVFPIYSPISAIQYEKNSSSMIQYLFRTTMILPIKFFLLPHRQDSGWTD